jgi:Ca2+-binding EF-hand superfamily protein
MSHFSLNLVKKRESKLLQLQHKLILLILDRPRLPVRMMRRVKVAALPGTSHSDENSRAATPSLDHLSENYTRRELEEYKQLFSMFDSDGSGAISNEELKAAIVSIGLQVSDEEIDELIKEVDEDQNGVIDFSEFCHCIRRSQTIMKSTNEEMVRNIFEIFDQDKNGVVSQNEFIVSF